MRARTILWGIFAFFMALTLSGIRLEALWGPYAFNQIALGMIAVGISVVALTIMFLPYLLLACDLIDGSES